MSKASNLRELFVLLEEARAKESRQYGITYHGMYKKEYAEHFVHAGIIRVYDTALPQHWLDRATKEVEPYGGTYDDLLFGVVWAYGDHTSQGSGPFPLTERAWYLMCCAGIYVWPGLTSQ